MFTHPLSTYLLSNVAPVCNDAAAAGRATRMLAIVSNAQGDPTFGSQSADLEVYEAAVLAAQRLGVAVYPILLRDQLSMLSSTSGSSSSRDI